jgi:hypothetical protein
MTDALDLVARLFARADVAYAVIGAHAVNAWLEPRLTADLDLTVQAGPDGMARLGRLLDGEGYRVSREHGADLPSGPDFVRFTSSDGTLTLELQAAKTGFQREVIRRAVGRLRIATVEDLIVMKLIANRPKDRVDLDGLVRLEGIDWSYVDHWATEWEVAELLHRVRAEAEEA